MSKREHKVIKQVQYESWVRTGILVVLLIGGVLTILLTNLATRQAVDELQEQSAAITDILNIVELEPLVASWEIEALFEEVTAGERDMRFAGDFRCNNRVPSELFIQFESTVRRSSLEGAPAPNIIRQLQVPVRAELICDQGQVDFIVPWDQLTGWRSIEAPTEYSLVIIASPANADTFTASRAQSDTFIINPPLG